MGKTPRPRYGHDRPANASHKEALRARFAQLGLAPPPIVCAALVWRNPAPDQTHEWIAHTAASWTDAPRDLVGVGDGLVGVRRKSNRQGRARWYGVVREVCAWDRGEARDARLPRGRRDVQGPWGAPQPVTDLVRDAGLCNHDGTPLDVQARVIVLWRVAMLEEGMMGALTLPARYLYGWHI